MIAILIIAVKMYAKRRFTAKIITKLHPSKLDIKNAFNSILRNVLLRKCMINCPEILGLASLTYGSPTPLIGNGNLIWSDSGVHGDHLGLLLFSLAIHDIASTMKSNFNVWYLDDATIAGDPRSVCNDIEDAHVCSLTSVFS